MKTEKIINISLVVLVSLVLIVILLYGMGVLQTFFQAPPSWKALGESGVSITNLNLVSDEVRYIPNSPYAVWTRKWDSTYWTIETSDGYPNKPIPSFSFSPQVSDDFNLRNTPVEIGTANGVFGGTSVTYTTKHSFGQGKDFRVEVFVDSDSGSSPISVNLIDVARNSLGGVQVTAQPGTSLLEIKSSPVVDTVQIFWNGQLVNTAQINQEFQIKINYNPPLKSAQDTAVVERVSLLNPAYKDIFNCQVDTNEQYYSFIFKGPITFAKTDLQNFHKWCLDEFPATIYTNAGATTDKMILMGLESGQSFVVPTGQLYQITYIGEKKSLTTPCELNELLVNGDTCTAKTVLEIDLICQSGGNCPGGEPQENVSDSNVSDSLIIETEAVDYILSSLTTHQFLADNSKIRFTHYKDDFSSSPASFSLFGKTFLSNGVTSQFGQTPKTSSFSYGTSVGELAIGDIQVLDEFNKVALTKVELQDPVTVDVGDTPAFLSEWTFEIDTKFLVLTYDEQTKEIIVTNNYYPVVGGMSLIKENNLGQQTSQDIQKSFPLGATRVSIGDTTGLVKIAGRPYFNVVTPDSNYKISGSSAITISDLEESEVIVNVQDESSTLIQLENIQGGNKATLSKPKIKISTGLIAGIVGGLVVGTSVFFIIRGLRRPRRGRR